MEESSKGEFRGVMLRENEGISGRKRIVFYQMFVPGMVGVEELNKTQQKHWKISPSPSHKERI